MTVHTTTSTVAGAASRAVIIPSAGFAATHTKTGWVELFASAPQSSHLLLRVLSESGTPDWAVDIGFGAPGAEVVKFPNAFFRGVIYYPQTLAIDLKIPAGTRVSVRSQPSSNTVRQFISAILYEDTRFGKGASPTEYTAYNVTVNGSATQLTNYVESAGTAHTKGDVLEVVASVPDNATRIILGNDKGGHGTNQHHLVEVVVSDDGETWDVLQPGLHYGQNTDFGASPITIACQGLTGKRLGLRMQSAVVATDSNRRKYIPVYIGTGAIEGPPTLIVARSTEMQRVIKNAEDAKLRQIVGKLRAETGQTRYEGDTTGIKLEWKINGTGDRQTSTNDIVMIDDNSPAFLCQLTQSESNSFAVGDRIDWNVEASAGEYLGDDGIAMVFETDFTGDNTDAIAAASGNTPAFASSPIARNEPVDTLRRVYLLIENAMGEAWEGDVAGVKALLTRAGNLVEDAETPSPSDIVRIAGKLHYVDPGQAYTNVPVGTTLTARVPAAEGRREAVSIASIGTAGVTVAPESIALIARETFKAGHGLSGYGVQQSQDANKLLVTIPGEGTVEVPAQFLELAKALAAFGTTG